MTLAAVRPLVLLTWALAAATTMAGVGAFRHSGGGRPLAVIRRSQDGKSYAFGYHVDATPEEDTLFDQFEERLGDRTRGQWRVALPDNRLQVVTYRADEDGFHADISYDYVVDLEAAKAIMASDESPWTSHFGVLFRDPDDHDGGDGAHGSHDGHGHGHGHGHGGGGGGGGRGHHAAAGRPAALSSLLTGQDSDRFNFIPDGTPIMIFQLTKPQSGTPKPRAPSPRPRPATTARRPPPRALAPSSRDPAPTARPTPRPSRVPLRPSPRVPAPTPRPSRAPSRPSPRAPAPTPRPSRAPPRPSPRAPASTPRPSRTPPRPSPRAPAPTPRPSRAPPRPSSRVPAPTSRPSPAVTTRVAERGTRRRRPSADSRLDPPVATSFHPDEEDIEVMPAFVVDLSGLTDTPYEHEDVLHRLFLALNLTPGVLEPHHGTSSSGEEDEDHLNKKDYAIENREIVLRRLEAIVHDIPIHRLHT